MCYCVHSPYWRYAIGVAVITAFYEYSMLNPKESLQTVTSVLFLSGYIPYLYQLVRRQVRPVLSMWAVWLLVDIVVLYGMVQKGEDVSQIGAATCGAGLITFLMLYLRSWRPGWTWTETVCTVGALTGIVLILVIPESSWHILVPSLAMLIAGIPAIQSAWTDYRNEGFWGWTLWSSSCIPALLVVHYFDGWTIASAVQKLSFVAFDASIMIVLLLSRLLVWMDWKVLPSDRNQPPPT